MFNLNLLTLIYLLVYNILLYIENFQQKSSTQSGQKHKRHRLIFKGLICPVCKLYPQTGIFYLKHSVLIRIHSSIPRHNIRVLSERIKASVRNITWFIYSVLVLRHLNALNGNMVLNLKPYIISFERFIRTLELKVIFFNQ